MTTTSQVTFPTTDMAAFLATDIAGTRDGSTVHLTAAQLAILAELPDDGDGHYDGTHIWIGGSEYAVRGMTTYTVQIEASTADGGIWQALAPSEQITSTGNAEDVAEITAADQNVAEGNDWRVVVWEGDRAEGEPAYVLAGADA